MFRHYIKIVLIICLAFTSGCWSQININDTAVCSGMGADLTESNKIVFVAQFNKPINQQENEGGESQFVVCSGVGDSITEAARKITLTLPRIPLWAHGDTFVIGEKLAKTDLSILVDFLYRNRKFRMNSPVFVANNESIEKIYNADCPLSLCSARGIIKILHRQEELLGVYSPILLNEFIVRAATPGFDPYAPLISTIKDLEGKDILTVDGMAIFKGKKMVGKLNASESRGFYWLNSRKPGGTISVSHPDDPDIKINLDTKKLKSKIRPHLNEENEIVMIIKTTADFNIMEVRGNIDQQSSEFIEKVEKAAAEEIKAHIKAAIKKGQETKSDYLGFGRRIYRYEPDYWHNNKADWPEIYADLETNVEVKVNLALPNLITSKFFKHMPRS